MRKLITVIALAGTVFGTSMAIVAADAHAAPIRECGSIRAGAGLKIRNITTRNMSCSWGRTFARQWAQSGFPRAIQGRERGSVRGCTTITDVRGTTGMYVRGRVRPAVIHFQAYGRACD